MKSLLLILAFTSSCLAGSSNGGLKEIASDSTLSGKGTLSEPLGVVGNNITIPDGANCAVGEASGGSGTVNEAQDCTDYVTQVEGDARAAEVDLSTQTIAIDTTTIAVNLAMHISSIPVHQPRVYTFSWGQDVGKGFKFKQNVQQTGPLIVYQGSATDPIDTVSIIASLKPGSATNLHLQLYDETNAKPISASIILSSETFTLFDIPLISSDVPSGLSILSIQGFIDDDTKEGFIQALRMSQEN